MTAAPLALTAAKAYAEFTNSSPGELRRIYAKYKTSPNFIQILDKELQRISKQAAAIKASATILSVVPTLDALTQKANEARRATTPQTNHNLKKNAYAFDVEKSLLMKMDNNVRPPTGFVSMRARLLTIDANWYKDAAHDPDIVGQCFSPYFKSISPAYDYLGTIETLMEFFLNFGMAYNSKNMQTALARQVSAAAEQPSAELLQILATTKDRDDRKKYRMYRHAEQIAKIGNQAKMYLPLPFEWTKDGGILDLMMTGGDADNDADNVNYYILKYFGIPLDVAADGAAQQSGPTSAAIPLLKTDRAPNVDLMGKFLESEASVRAASTGDRVFIGRYSWLHSMIYSLPENFKWNSAAAKKNETLFPDKTELNENAGLVGPNCEINKRVLNRLIESITPDKMFKNTARTIAYQYIFQRGVNGDAIVGDAKHDSLILFNRAAGQGQEQGLFAHKALSGKESEGLVVSSQMIERTCEKLAGMIYDGIGPAYVKIDQGVGASRQFTQRLARMLTIIKQSLFQIPLKKNIVKKLTPFGDDDLKGDLPELRFGEAIGEANSSQSQQSQDDGEVIGNAGQEIPVAASNMFRDAMKKTIADGIGRASAFSASDYAQIEARVSANNYDDLLLNTNADTILTKMNYSTLPPTNPRYLLQMKSDDFVYINYLRDLLDSENNEVTGVQGIIRKCVNGFVLSDATIEGMRAYTDFNLPKMTEYYKLLTKHFDTVIEMIKMRDFNLPDASVKAATGAITFAGLTDVEAAARKMATVMAKVNDATTPASLKPSLALERKKTEDEMLALQISFGEKYFHNYLKAIQIKCANVNKEPILNETLRAIPAAIEIGNAIDAAYNKNYAEQENLRWRYSRDPSLIQPQAGGDVEKALQGDVSYWYLKMLDVIKKDFDSFLGKAKYVPKLVAASYSTLYDKLNGQFAANLPKLVDKIKETVIFDPGDTNPLMHPEGYAARSASFEIFVPYYTGVFEAIRYKSITNANLPDVEPGDLLNYKGVVVATANEMDKYSSGNWRGYRDRTPTVGSLLGPTETRVGPVPAETLLSEFRRRFFANYIEDSGKMMSTGAVSDFITSGQRGIVMQTTYPHYYNHLISFNALVNILMSVSGITIDPLDPISTDVKKRAIREGCKTGGGCQATRQGGSQMKRRYYTGDGPIGQLLEFLMKR